MRSLIPRRTGVLGKVGRVEERVAFPCGSGPWAYSRATLRDHPGCAYGPVASMRLRVPT